MEKINKVFNNIVFKYLVITIIMVNFLYWIGQKKGLFSDEVFSYGSSNYRYDIMFRPYDYANALNRVIFENNWVSLIKDINEAKAKVNEIESNQKPIWKTREDAKDYVTIGLKDVLRFDMVYFNQAMDVHPPLFYMLVHLVSIFFLGVFSKYIIFIINVAIFGVILYFLKKIFDYLKIKNFWILALVFSISLWSTTLVIFQRMYALMSMFMVIYTYFAIKIINNDFEFDKKNCRKLLWTIVLGGLSHYYFLVYILFSFIFIQCLLIYKKSENSKKYFKVHFLSGIVFCLLFPPAIFHIFFSYRGVGSFANHVKLLELFNLLTGFNKYVIILIGVSILIFAIVKKKAIINYLIFVIFMFLVVIKFKSPFSDVRYIMTVFPILFILLAIMLNSIRLEKLKYLIIVLLIILNVSFLFIKKPEYLFTDYSKYIEVANKYRDLDFIYVEDNWYNHIKDIEEFMIYKRSLILDHSLGNVKVLSQYPELKNDKAFVVSINFYLNQSEILNMIKEYTDHTKVTKLIDFENNKYNYNTVYLFEK